MMIVRDHVNCNMDGKIFHSYLATWTANSNLFAFASLLIETFRDNPPCVLFLYLFLIF